MPACELYVLESSFGWEYWLTARVALLKAGHTRACRARCHLQSMRLRMIA